MPTEHFWIFATALLSAAVLVAERFLISPWIARKAMRDRSEMGARLHDRAFAIRGAPKPLPTDPTGAVVWGVSEKQILTEMEFCAFALMRENRTVLDQADATKLALGAVLEWHGLDPEQPPTGQLYDILHKEDLIS